jgi:hypothetical protein
MQEKEPFSWATPIDCMCKVIWKEQECKVLLESTYNTQLTCQGAKSIVNTTSGICSIEKWIIIWHFKTLIFIQGFLKDDIFWLVLKLEIGYRVMIS